ncbi:Ig-like domain repeat protein [Aeromicrobium endophyticum]|uniref:Bacterial Ig-like domain-containing protein n=1 Tax=Aeromicrobium endophyticum TaxID=2292704 RepID=A0A371P3X6_9ACTN|nr:Ig-like domain repeat protein [Aeromicrobium endophyticum]REK70647.1 hypothetical protein DX116_16170 [Aeromicrobium endophyticum]
MKRSSLLLSLTLALGVLSAPAQAEPTSPQGRPAELLRYVGDPGSALGSAISNGPCDVDGDGHDDAVVGAWFWTKGDVARAGAAYVLLGGDHVSGGALADPSEAGAVRIDGPVENPKVGSTGTKSGYAVAFSVGCVGDVNGDGLDDIAIGDYQQQRAYVIFGAKKFTGLSLDAIGDRGFVVKGDASSGNLSFSLAGVGDLDGDGLDELAVAEVGASTRGRSTNGRVWVVAGRDDITDVDVTAPQPGQILQTVDGELSGARLGVMARAGDVNGDGKDDFVLGSYTSTPWGSGVAAPGAAYVVFGGTTGDVDLAALGARGFKIYGPQRARDRLGYAVSPAGDVDGDGLDDVLIGADGVTNAATGPRNGGAAVVFGSTSTATVYTDPSATGGQSVFTCPVAGESVPSCVTPSRRGYWLNGVASGDATGFSVAGIGDVTGDDVPDLALGAYGHDPVDPAAPTTTMNGAGAVFVVAGDPTQTVQQLSGLAATAGYRIDGTRAGDRLGRQVGLAGDLDGNGVRDLVAGADFASRVTSGSDGELVVALMGLLRTGVGLDAPATIEPSRTATFTASVTKPAGSRTAVAGGTVTFASDGVPVAGCAEVAVSSGSVVCTTSWQGRGTHEITAVFSGTDALATSTSDARSVSVGSDAVLEPSAAPSMTYGTSSAALTGSVRGGDGPATGTVEVREGGSVLGRGAVQDGTFAVGLGATALTPGRHTLTLAYGGDERVRPVERTVSVDVAKASPRIAFARSRGTLKGKRRLTVTVDATARGVTPTGRVQVRVGSKVVRTVTLKNGRVRTTLPRLGRKGLRKISVTYVGSPLVGPGASRVKTVRQK